MNKKLLIGFAVVFVLVFATDFVVNNYLMMSEYEATMTLWRRPEEMKMAVIVIAQLFFAFFFTLIFSKGYEGKGVVEGIRYGVYVALMMMVPAAYMTYATMPVPYSLALKWFLYGTIQYIIYGIALSYVYGMKEKAPAA
jgi:hypothetical protein